MSRDQPEPGSSPQPSVGRRPWLARLGVSQGFKIGRPKRFCGRGPIFSWAWSLKNVCFRALPQFFVVMELWCCYSLNLGVKYTDNNLNSI